MAMVDARPVVDADDDAGGGGDSGGGTVGDGGHDKEQEEQSVEAESLVEQSHRHMSTNTTRHASVWSCCLVTRARLGPMSPTPNARVLAGVSQLWLFPNHFHWQDLSLVFVDTF